MTSKLDHQYLDTISTIKQKIREARLRTSIAVNSELILLYWDIGHEILEKQKTLGWGSKVLDTLSRDLKREFPEMKGFSVRNLKYMRTFAREFPNNSNRQQLAAQIPWGHNMVLLEKISELRKREWYIEKCIEHGWSRNGLVHQIENRLFERQADKSIKSTNFLATLPVPQSELAHEILKDPYKFDFLTITDGAQEQDIENQLITHITNFLLELGAGFAYMGRQVHFELAGSDFYIDLLFYHTKLRCYVVIELKSGKFKPEHTGKLNFYLTLVDKELKHQQDNPTIGLLLCKDKNKLVAEYALKDINKPIGVSEYQLVESLLRELKSSLPSIDEIEEELSKS